MANFLRLLGESKEKPEKPRVLEYRSAPGMHRFKGSGPPQTA